MPDDNELFNDEFMNDILLNPKAYGMTDGLEDEFDYDDEDNVREDFVE